jgi:hypothetical protein
MAIAWYEHLALPADAVAAAEACLKAAPPRPPGSSDEFFAAAGRLSRIAQAFRDALGTLAKIAADDSAWTGDAADAFRNILDDPRRTRLDQVPDRYDGYARALREYASGVDGHQAGIDSARADVQAALAAYHRVGLGRPPTVVTQFTPLSAAPGYQTAVQSCRRAADGFRVSYNAWIDSALRCQHAVKRVDADPLHNPHGARLAVDAISKVADWLSNATAALALIALPCPPAAIFLLELSSVFSAVELAADIDRKVQYHENVTPADFAFAALGCLPVVDPAREGLAAGRAAKAGGLAGRAGAAAKAAASSLRDEAKAIPAAAATLKRAGWWRALGRSDLNAVPRALAENWGGQNGAVAAVSIGRGAYDNRHRGYRSAIQKSTITVLLGPLATSVEAAVHAVENPDGRPDPAFVR